MATMQLSDTRASRLGVVIVGGGSGTRFGADDKVFAPLASRPLILHSLDVFAGRDDVVAVVLVLGRHTLDRGCELLMESRPDVIVCAGGETRAESVMAGMDVLPAEVDLVAVHDAARPLASGALVERVLRAAIGWGAAIPALPVTDTVHEVGDEATIERTPERSRLWAAQTPQIARRDWLEHAYGMDGPATDDAGRLRTAGYPVRVVEGEPDNIKITWPGDLAVADLLLLRRRDVAR